MNNIHKRINKKGVVTWQVTLRKAGRPTISATFKDRSEAEVFRRITLARLATEERREQERVAPSLDLPTSGRLEDEELKATFAMFAASDSCMIRHRKLMPAIERNLNGVKIGELRPSWGVDYAARMRKKTTRRKTFYSYESIVSHITMINVVLKWRAEGLDIAPTRLAFDTKKLPKDWAVKRTRRLEAGEEIALMKRISEIDAPSRTHWGLLVKLAIETGTRLQELVRSEWREVNMGGGFWTIPKQHTKSKKERVVPMTSGAIEAFTELKGLANPTDPRIFHTLKNPASVSSLFHRWAKEAGLIDFRFHDLRHEGISRFILTQRNLSIHEIMQIVGHSSPAMLARYSNLRGDELAQKIIRSKPSGSPNISTFGVNHSASDFAPIRGQVSITKPAAQIYGPISGTTSYVDSRRKDRPGPLV